MRIIPFSRYLIPPSETLTNTPSNTRPLTHALSHPLIHTHLHSLTHPVTHPLTLLRTNSFTPQVEEDEWLAVHPPHLASPYGLLRSPWNYNPSPVLTRYNNMHQIQFNNVVATAKIFYLGSDCAEYQSFVKKYAVGQTYQTYLTESEDNVHGKV